MRHAAALAVTLVLAAGARAAEPPAVRLAVPAQRQAPERCGPAALEMVLRYYGAGPAALAEAERAYDPVLRGALVTDLAQAGRRAGFDAQVVTLAPDSLPSLLARGLPPILLLQSGLGPITRGHYAVAVGWDPARARYWINDGGADTRIIGATELERRWRGGDYRALLVRPGAAR